MSLRGLLEGPGGWLLSPEGAVVLPVESVAVVADVHLGYEWARGDRGDCVPAHSLAETLSLLSRLLDRVAFSRLVVAGDLVESRRACVRTARDVARLTEWLADRGIELFPLAGNHDPPRRPALPATLDVAGWTITHGHQIVDTSRMIFGHHHPSLRASGVSAPCFLVSDSSILLPAFSPNAAGVSLCSLDRSLTADRRCIAAAGGVLLDFGPVSRLVRELAAKGW